MSQPARRNAAADPHVELATEPAVSRGQKVSVYLVTLDESLWPQIGQRLDKDFVLRQVDTIEELLRTARAGQSGVVIWDAREQEDPADELSRLQGHSARLAIIVLDSPTRASAWKSARRQHQIVALLGVPFDNEELLESLVTARDECHARSAVLDEGVAAAAAAVAATAVRKPPWIALFIAAVCAVCGAAYLIHRHFAAPSSPPPARPAAALPAAPAASVAPAVPAPAASAADEQIDTLLEKARQAMLDRRFIEPESNNALTLYQSVIAFDPNNGEARQGLQRLGQILFARVQSDLDDRKYDRALQALETARSLSPDDPRLAELDARVTTLRAELGSTQIQAALNAKNFERALQLIDEAAGAKSLSNAKLTQLRELVRRRQAESEVEGVLTLLGMRMRQDRLLEPKNDNALYYLKLAREAGASPSDLAEPTEELGKKLMRAAHAALDEHRIGDADRLLEEARKIGVPPKLIAAQRRELSVARELQAQEKMIHSQALDLGQARLAQGELLEPANDNALYYVNQLRATDPSNPQLARISAALEGAIVARARAARDSGDTAAAASMLDSASALGASTELDALRDALAQDRAKQARADASRPATVAANSLIAVKPLKLDYPRGALVDGKEGWVDLAFNVTTEGKVTNVTVVSSSPRYLFDSAARTALARVRYQPVMVDGKAVEVSSTLRVAFRLRQP